MGSEMCIRDRHTCCRGHSACSNLPSWGRCRRSGPSRSRSRSSSWSWSWRWRWSRSWSWRWSGSRRRRNQLAALGNRTHISLLALCCHEGGGFGEPGSIYNEGGEPLHMDRCQLGHVGLELPADRPIPAPLILFVELGAGEEGNNLAGAWASASGRAFGVRERRGGRALGNTYLLANRQCIHPPLGQRRELRVDMWKHLPPQALGVALVACRNRVQTGSFGRRRFGRGRHPGAGRRREAWAGTGQQESVARGHRGWNLADLHARTGRRR